MMSVSRNYRFQRNLTCVYISTTYRGFCLITNHFEILPKQQNIKIGLNAFEEYLFFQNVALKPNTERTLSRDICTFSISHSR